MSSKSKPVLTSSLGKKLIMSLTGLFLCTFLVVHLIGNLQLFKDDAGYAFNNYAYFMTHFTPIKVVSYLLYASIVVHAIYALVLTRQNKAARPVGYYQSSGNANSKWNSRNMGILGTVILVFLATHMQNFWWQYKFGTTPYVEYQTELESGNRQINASDEIPPNYDGYKIFVNNGVEVIQTKDLYKQVEYTFKNPLIVLLYVIAMAALAFHLIHGFQSAFQTLGFNHRRYIGLIKGIGIWIFGVIIPIAFAAMPLYFYFKSL
ncbi:succinate dehydrogenase cytochrome b subunit [Parapusillimonas sp. SGNA-6]|uniref:succinate dehydrogenase cytochrome b subunit n=1 Tax=Parapedobacter sp. SGR-10 TaxID=2710879 RepID=UPI0013CFF8DB|nr:succinate dehydrogenase cytochrome b subunit [Parapedobacter sp. SGR-10]NGF57601.1 succinate dehydrogenase cytochrome b subunit [Parapedobacter sp. SGR-10]NGM89520.1 succinate dehydrogenase cytochrome b subunit [Parapusillimonas sp. SGNA-6]